MKLKEAIEKILRLKWGICDERDACFFVSKIDTELLELLYDINDKDSNATGIEFFFGLHSNSAVSIIVSEDLIEIRCCIYKNQTAVHALNQTSP